MKTFRILLVASTALLTANFALAQTWTQTSALLTWWGCVVSSADGKTLLAAASQRVYTSTNSGATWVSNNVPEPGQQLINGSLAISADGTKLIACGTYGTIYISTNSGAAWNEPNGAAGVRVAASADGNKLVVAGGYGLYTSTNSGATWTKIQTSVPVAYSLSIASSADGTKLVAASHSGGIYASTNSGVTWTQTDAPVTNWYSIACSADGNKLVAAGTGLLCLSTNAGVTWTQADVPGYNWISVASSTNGSRLVAGISYGGFAAPIFVSTDSGMTWTQLPFTDHSTNRTQCTSVASSADGLSLVAAFLGEAGGSIYTYTLPPAPSPTVSISLTNFLRQQKGPANYALVSWPSSATNFIVQQSWNLSTADWTTVTNTPTLVTNLKAQTTNYQVILPLTNSSGFYRLKTP
jgi:photosystem II stability/assembly factor-like uncharacterized protein